MDKLEIIHALLNEISMLAYAATYNYVLNFLL